MKTPFTKSKGTGSTAAEPKPKKTKNKKKKNRKPETIAGDGTTEQSLAAAAGRYGIWVAVMGIAFLAFLGAGLGALALLTNPAQSVATEITKQEKENINADQAAAYSQGYLNAYLTATKEDYNDLAHYLGDNGARQTTQYVEEAAPIRNPIVASVEKTKYNFYSTKIQVEVKGTETKKINGKEETIESWNTQWYKVIVTSDGKGNFTPSGYPSATNAPTTTNRDSSYPYSVNNEEVKKTVGDFGKAYMTETGDVNRYISPGAQITALSPAPYKEAKLTKVSALESLDGAVPEDGVKVYVQAEYQVTDQSGATRTQTYPLELTSRGGRWEVSTIERSPHTF